MAAAPCELLVQVPSGYKGETILRQRPGGAVGRLEFIHEIEQQSIPIAAVDHLALIAEVIQDIGWMRARLIDLRVAALVLGGDIGDVIGDLHQLVTAVVGLPDDALPGLGDVMLEAYHILKAELLFGTGQ